MVFGEYETLNALLLIPLDVMQKDYFIHQRFELVSECLSTFPFFHDRPDTLDSKKTKRSIGICVSKSITKERDSQRHK